MVKLKSRPQTLKSKRSNGVNIVGIDIGGTFTDFVLFDGRSLRTHKVLSQPEAPAQAIIEGLRGLKTGGEIEIIHGTTVATNALLERKGAKVALVTTKGFEDIIEIGRQARGKLYDIGWQREPPLVARDMRLGITERIDYQGNVIKKLSRAELNEALKRIKGKANSIAVCFLFSYKNSRHEKAAESILAKLKLPISASYKILPEYREYERFSTTILNAYLAPIMDKYLDNLEHGLGKTKLRIMGSSGGTLTTIATRQKPVHTILSGPTGGVIATVNLIKNIRHDKAISIDIGGTSTDVSLIDGSAKLTKESSVSGVPLRIPVVEINTVGAGGGSIARLDKGGALIVGPESAGAQPGPICYGRGGKDITVTDANLFLGRIDAEHFFGGRLKLDIKNTQTAISKVAKEAGLTPQAIAEGIIKVANTNMEKAIRAISVERGYDPADFTLVAFGGAGSLHACTLAESLGMKGVLVPLNPGVFSALGLTMADVTKSASKTLLRDANATKNTELENLFNSLENDCVSELASEGVPTRKILSNRYLDMRYEGQSYEVMTAWKGSIAKTIDEFHKLHQRRYGYKREGDKIQIVNAGIELIVPQKKAEFTKIAKRKRRCEPYAIKQCIFEGKLYKTRFYDRKTLGVGAKFRGPAVIVENTATTFLQPNFSCEVDSLGNMHLKTI